MTQFFIHSSYIRLDVIRRTLESQGLTVLQVMGVTDIDDKIIARSQLVGKLLSILPLKILLSAACITLYNPACMFFYVNVLCVYLSAKYPVDTFGPEVRVGVLS